MMPVFSVKTVSTAKPALPLLQLADRIDPIYWAKDDFELSGSGRRLTFRFSGPTRFTQAQQAWDTILAEADIADEVSQNGTGLVSFTSFSFSADSEEASVLIFPEVIHGRVGDDYFETRLKIVGGTQFDAPLAAAGQYVLTETLPVLPSDDDSAAQFLNGVTEITDQITAGALEKAVLARTVVRMLPKTFDPRKALATLRTNYADCWTFRVENLFGASPETLFEIHDGDYSLRILAGSAARGTTAEDDEVQRDDLFHSVKNRNEHDFAVDSGIDALQPVSQTLTASATFMLKLKNLWHIATDLSGTLAHGQSPLSVLEKLHPTAAVAGTPRREALALIAATETFNRGRYSGPVGWMNNAGDGQWAIALRCAKQYGQSVVAYAGCGIVAGSDPLTELAETELKLTPVLEAIQNGSDA